MDVSDSKTSHKRVAIASAIGTAIEFYDFTLFGIFTPILSTVFFSESELRLTLVIFASSFIMRPIGALIFGYIGDKIGRKTALTLTIILMSFPTFIIGILPSYDSIGLLAPILLIFCRLSQGLFAGGEHNGAAVYVIEHWPKNYSGMASSIIITGVFLGVFMAVFSGILVTTIFPLSYAWRIPFIGGVVIGLVGLYIRLKLTETPSFVSFSKTSFNKTPLSITITDNFYSLFSTFTIGGFAGIIGYTIAVYINIHLHSYVGLSFQVSTLITAVCMFSAFISSLIIGKIADKYGSLNIMIVASVIIGCSIYTIYQCLNSSSLNTVIGASIVLGALTGMYCSPLHAVITQMFPVKIRYTGTSFGYSLGMSIFGGTTPIVSTLLIDSFNSLAVPALYIVIASLFNLFILFSWKFKFVSKLKYYQ